MAPFSAQRHIVFNPSPEEAETGGFLEFETNLGVPGQTDSYIVRPCVQNKSHAVGPGADLRWGTPLHGAVQR